MNFLKPPEQRPRRRSLQAIPDEKEVKEFFDEDNAEMALLKMLQQNSRRRVSLPNPQVKHLDPSSKIPQPTGKTFPPLSGLYLYKLKSTSISTGILSRK